MVSHRQHPTDDPLPTRESLLSRLKDWQSDSSWRDFFNIYWRLIYGAAIRAGLTPAEAEDVLQETVLAVAKKIKTFRYDRTRGSFKGWLLQLTSWRISDQLRRRARSRVKGVQNLEAALAKVPDPSGGLEAFWETEWEQTLLDGAMERLKLRHKAEHLQIFDLYVTKQWPVDKVAQTLNIKEAQVYLIKHRICEALKQEVRQLEAEFR